MSTPSDLFRLGTVTNLIGLRRRRQLCDGRELFPRPRRRLFLRQALRPTPQTLGLEPLGVWGGRAPPDAAVATEAVREAPASAAISNMWAR